MKPYSYGLVVMRSWRKIASAFALPCVRSPEEFPPCICIAACQVGSWLGKAPRFPSAQRTVRGFQPAATFDFAQRGQPFRRGDAGNGGASRSTETKGQNHYCGLRFRPLLDSLDCVGRGNGGATGDRTPDLRIANATLSRLSYRPTYLSEREFHPVMQGRQDTGRRGCTLVLAREQWCEDRFQQRLAPALQRLRPVLAFQQRFQRAARGQHAVRQPEL